MRINSFSKKQAEILKFACSDDNYLICDGAVRSGKTVCMTLAFVLWAMENFNHTNFAICSKTVANAERNILKPFQTVEGLPYTMTYKLSNRMLTIRCGRRENYFYLFGGKDESSYMLIQGITLAGVLLDEVALMPQSFVDQALARTLTYANAKIWFNCNPDSPNHWFYKTWVCHAQERGAKRLKFLMQDNPTLSAQEIERAKTMFQGVFYQRYILGEWVVAEGAIYKIFSDHPKRYLTNTPDFDLIQVGVDFGGNKSAHTFVATGLKNNYSKLTVLRSERHEAQGVTPDELYTKLEQFICRVEETYGRISCIYADSAEQTLISGMKARLKIPVRNSLKRPIIDRIRATTSLMAQGKFLMTVDCETLKNALETAVYDDKKMDDTRLDDGTSDIDTLDAFEYSWENRLRQYVRG